MQKRLIGPVTYDHDRRTREVIAWADDPAHKVMDHEFADYIAGTIDAERELMYNGLLGGWQLDVWESIWQCEAYARAVKEHCRHA
jgi:hypothetical protein